MKMRIRCNPSVLKVLAFELCIYHLCFTSDEDDINMKQLKNAFYRLSWNVPELVNLMCMFNCIFLFVFMSIFHYGLSYVTLLNV